MEILHVSVFCILGVGAFVGFAVLIFSLIAICDRKHDNHIDKTVAGWLATLGLMFVLCCTTGLSAGLTDFARTSGWAMAAAVVLNLLVQPVWLLICWSCVTKIALGLSGRVVYAWRAVKTEELADIPSADRSSLSLFCVFQGALILPVALAGSICCAMPFLQFFFT